jgi:hypothetical protein
MKWNLLSMETLMGDYDDWEHETRFPSWSLALAFAFTSTFVDQVYK